MKLFNAIASTSIAGCIAIATAPASAMPICSQIKGAKIIAEDGTYLGKIDHSLSSESIFNKLGRYGSELSSTSIWSDLGRYGGELSSQSPFNDLSSRPPMIITTDNRVGKLTVNKMVPHSISPYIAAACFA